ncbi:ABC transporter ATP-binding protein [Mycoplasma capricolum]|uniref:ABC transporter ATP-binding protein n=1 Tax=Mycoplasma capricolum subsp. capripneumoniae 87001 TaxID=1124992 RepID=A0A9N7B680_MYCCC|nr:ABC transporter ATP-binding protein [Mycoplasma capricolum]AJK51493.1 ABC transporter ATP-binding protein [Mycoplasma capricolum subsp. capripneumoniae 87001]AOQ22158.1 ABC transporter ATP-binding protein [Mycoplasma capricolum subsp. capripneumoniae M1601]KEY84521.1 Glycerol transporter subunit A [Mycoplasma capricolum subsp. capripneumoniae 99108]WGD33028.1 Vitamin B12 import ATP-binding protein BtuD [Mycoplasma capricolum subsp. capripneumoniae]CDZ18323.1 Glycerol ABC transporter, ATP-bi
MQKLNEDILIQIKNLKFKYHKKQKDYDLIIDDLKIEKNKIISLLGPSGSGKTTLLNLLLGYIKPQTGTIDILNNPKIHEIAYIMQENSTYENTTVFNNVFLSAKNYSKWVDSAYLKFFNHFFNNKENFSKRTIDQFEIYKKLLNQKKANNKLKKQAFFKLIFLVLIDNKVKNKFKFLKQIHLKNLFKDEIQTTAKKLNIDHLLNKNVNQLSGGQKQRVAFAKGIIKKTNLVLLDEPFSALDAKIKESTIDWLIKIKKEFNLSMIIVTHDQQDALKISDQIILLDKGKIQQFSSGEQMYNNPNNLFVAKFIGSPEINFIKKQDDKSYYIRHNKIKVKPNKNAKYQIIEKKSFGDKVHYLINFNKDIKWTLVLNDDSLEINDKIDLDYNNSDVLVFDKKGNRIYE